MVFSGAAAADLRGWRSRDSSDDQRRLPLRSDGDSPRVEGAFHLGIHEAQGVHQEIGRRQEIREWRSGLGGMRMVVVGGNGGDYCGGYGRSRNEGGNGGGQ